MKDERNGPARSTRRDFLKLVVGGAVGLPAVAWAVLPGAAGANERLTISGLKSTPQPRKTPTPKVIKPTPTPKPSKSKATPTPTPTPTQPPAPEAAPPPAAAPSGPVANVGDYGAKGNGKTDDFRAIQRAIDAVAGNPEAVVSIPAGTYFISQGLSITRPVRIVGESMDGAVLLARSEIRMVGIEGTAGVEIAGLTLQGMGTHGTYGPAIELVNAGGVTVRECRLRDIPETAISLWHVHDVTITDCQFSGVRYSGVRIQHPGAGNVNRNVTVRNCTFQDVNTAMQSGNAPIQAHGGDPDARHEYITVEGNVITTSGVGIGLDAVDYGVVLNNRITGSGLGYEGIAFCGSNNTISGNQVNNYGAAGILLWGVAYRPIANNIIRGNTCWDNSQGIAIVCGEDRTVIDGLQVVENRCFASSPASRQQYGVQSYIDGTTNFTWRNVVIANNDLRGNTRGAISLVPPAQATIYGNLG